MAKKTTKSSSSAAAGVIVTGPQEEAAPAPVIAEPASGPAGESVPAGNHDPESESESTSEGSGNPAAPATTNAVEDDTHTPVKPLTGSDLIEAIVAETETPTFVSISPEAEAAASGTNSEPSQGAAEDDEGMAGAVHALVIEAGAESVEQLLHFADLGKRLAYAASVFGIDPGVWLDAIEPPPSWPPIGVIGVDLARPGSDVTVTGNAATVRVKSTRDGFRRAGLVLSKGWRTFRPGELTEEQLDALDADPSITVEPV